MKEDQKNVAKQEAQVVKKRKRTESTDELLDHEKENSEEEEIEGREKKPKSRNTYKRKEGSLNHHKGVTTTGSSVAGSINFFSSNSSGKPISSDSLTRLEECRYIKLIKDFISEDIERAIKNIDFDLYDLSNIKNWDEIKKHLCSARPHKYYLIVNDTVSLEQIKKYELGECIKYSKLESEDNPKGPQSS